MNAVGAPHAEPPPRLWVLVGATGTGKTALSLDLAEALAARGRAAEIVNADAMQLYRGMNIGTAKLPETERRGIRHHLFDVFEPHEDAAVAAYQPLARGAIEAIHTRGADAIVVGGSGLYVSSVVYDFRFPPRDEALRAELEAQAQAQGAGALHERLRGLDPRAADAIDPRNERRVIRALEVALRGGESHGAESYGGALPAAPALWRANTRLIGVHLERAQLVPRLDARVEAMWAAGLVAEAAGLRAAGFERGTTAPRAIGYAQALAQIDGALSEAEAIAQTQALTRRYARRQVSWFRRYDGIRWITALEPPAAHDAAAALVAAEE